MSDADEGSPAPESADQLGQLELAAAASSAAPGSDAPAGDAASPPPVPGDADSAGGVERDRESSHPRGSAGSRRVAEGGRRGHSNRGTALEPAAQPGAGEQPARVSVPSPAAPAGAGPREVGGAASRDRDAELKLRAARMLWSMGYACFFEVALSAREHRDGELRRYDLTDLDVVGVRFDDDLRWTTVVVDCKSGRVSVANRLFWLRGVMDFFAADHGYLAQPSLPREVRELALRLSVSLLDDENLTAFEKDKGLARLPLTGFSLAAYDAFRLAWRPRVARVTDPTAPADRVLPRLYNYLSYGYWFNEEHRTLQQLVTAVAEASETARDRLTAGELRVAMYTALTLLSVSLLKLCANVQATAPADLHREVRRYLFGGAAAAAERQRLAEAVARVTGRPLPLEPPFYDDLLELVHRWIRYSRFAKHVPRYIDLVLREVVLAGRPDSIERLLGRAFELDALKLSKDAAQFLSRAARLESDVFSELMRQ